MLSRMDLEALLRAARDGNPEAWDALHRWLSGELRRYFLRQFDESTAVELTQRTMKELSSKLPGFQEESSLRGWVFGIARNQGRLEHRARAQSSKALSELAARVLMKTPNTSPTERVHAKEVRAMLLEAIEALPARLRRVIEHDLANDGSIEDEQLAAREGIQPGTVWSRRHRAITLLRDRLMARLNTPPQPPIVADSTTSSSA